MAVDLPPQPVVVDLPYVPSPAKWAFYGFAFIPSEFLPLHKDRSFVVCSLVSLRVSRTAEYSVPYLPSIPRPNIFYNQSFFTSCLVLLSLTMAE